MKKEGLINKDSTSSRKNAAILLKLHDKNILERTFLFYINEAYEIKIIDTTFYEDKKMNEIYSKELMPLFLNYLYNNWANNTKEWSKSKSNIFQYFKINNLTFGLQFHEWNLKIWLEILLTCFLILVYAKKIAILFNL